MPCILQPGIRVASTKVRCFSMYMKVDVEVLGLGCWGQAATSVCEYVYITMYMCIYVFLPLYS